MFWLNLSSHSLVGLSFTWKTTKVWILKRIASLLWLPLSSILIKYLTLSPPSSLSFLKYFTGIIIGSSAIHFRLCKCCSTMEPHLSLLKINLYPEIYSRWAFHHFRNQNRSTHMKEFFYCKVLYCRQLKSIGNSWVRSRVKSRKNWRKEVKRSSWNGGIYFIILVWLEF